MHWWHSHLFPQQSIIQFTEVAPLGSSIPLSFIIPKACPPTHRCHAMVKSISSAFQFAVLPKEETLTIINILLNFVDHKTVCSDSNHLFSRPRNSLSSPLALSRNCMASRDSQQPKKRRKRVVNHFNLLQQRLSEACLLFHCSAALELSKTKVLHLFVE